MSRKSIHSRNSPVKPHPFALPFSQRRIESMSDAERRGPVAPRPAKVRRGRRKKAEEEARAFLESQGIPVGICEACGHVAGTNADCEECQ